MAPSLFHRAGGGTASYDDFSKVLPLFEGLTDPAIVMDVDAALDFVAGHRHPARAHRHRRLLHGRPGDVPRRTRARARGRGRASTAAGSSTGRFPQFPTLVERTAELQTPWLGLFGDQDGSIPVEDVEALRMTLDEEAPVAHQVVRYADADHGFHCDVRPSYDPEAAADAWQRTLAWFDEYLG